MVSQKFVYWHPEKKKTNLKHKHISPPILPITTNLQNSTKHKNTQAHTLLTIRVMMPPYHVAAGKLHLTVMLSPYMLGYL